MTHVCSFCKKRCSEACADFTEFMRLNLRVLKNRFFHRDHVDFLLDGNLVHFKNQEFYMHGSLRLVN